MEYPIIGFGTYKLRPQEVLDKALDGAFSNGYKMIDTAEIYKNQKFIGNYLKSRSIKREDIWITSKVSFANMKKDMETVKKGILQTFTDLQTDYVDLYLIHAPVEQTYIETWNYLRELQKEGKIRYIGLSNFTLPKLIRFRELIGDEKHIFCNQIEFNPFLNRKELVKYCQDNNIKVIAYGSLYKKNELIEQIGKKHNKTAEQILLKFAIQKNIHVIPMSEVHEYQKMNIEIDFILDDKDMELMNELDENYSQYPRYL